MSEIRYGLCTVIYSCRDQPRSISSAKGTRGIRRIRDRKRKRTDSGNGNRGSPDIGSSSDIRGSWRKTAIVRGMGAARPCRLPQALQRQSCQVPRLLPRSPISRTLEYLDWLSISTSQLSPRVVVSAPHTKSEQLKFPNVYLFTQRTFEDTWGVLECSLDSYQLQCLLLGVRSEGFHILRGSREHVGASTRQGNGFSFSFQVPRDSLLVGTRWLRLPLVLTYPGPRNL